MPGPFIWDVRDRWGQRVVLTLASWDRHRDKPGHLAPLEAQGLVGTSYVRFYDPLDVSVKYLGFAMGPRIHVVVAIVNPLTDPWTMRTAHYVRQIPRDWKEGLDEYLPSP